MMLWTMVALADEIPECQPYVWGSVPERDATGVPRDVAPLLFTEGGCDEPALIEVFAGTTSVGTQNTVLDGFQVVRVGYDAWEPGPYTIELTRSELLVDRIAFTVADTLAEPSRQPQAAISATSPDRYELHLDVSLDDPAAYEVLAIEHPNGTRVEVPAATTLTYRFDGGYVEGEVCLDLIGRGFAEAYSEPVEHCTEVVLLEEPEEKGCGCTATRAGFGSGGPFAMLAALGRR